MVAVGAGRSMGGAVVLPMPLYLPSSSDYSAGAGLLFGRLGIIMTRHSGIVPLAAAG